MLWYPAIVVLALGNATLLIAIALATVSRRHERGAEHDIAALSALAVDAARAHVASVSHAVLWPRRAAVSPELVVIASDRNAADRVSAIRLLGTHCDPQSRRALAGLLTDPDSAIRREAAAAAGTSARVGYPEPLDQVVVDHLLRLLDDEQVHTVVVEAIDALAYSLDPRIPTALLRRIPSSRGSMRERLIEAGALFTHLAQSTERPHLEAGV